jgi:hypothetical protein
MVIRSSGELLNLLGMIINHTTIEVFVGGILGKAVRGY